MSKDDDPLDLLLKYYHFDGSRSRKTLEKEPLREKRRASTIKLSDK